MRESSFSLSLNPTFRGKYDTQAWQENNGSIRKLDPYRDGFEVLGKLERKDTKEKDIDSKLFMVSTSKFDKTLLS